MLIDRHGNVITGNKTVEEAKRLNIPRWAASRESRPPTDGETGQGVGFTPYSPQRMRSKNARVSSCGVKVQWPYPPADP